MKFILQFAAILILSLVLQLFLPWFIVVVVAIAAGFLLNTDKGWQNFLAGFLAILVLWLGSAIFMDHSAGGLISERLGAQFGLPGAGFTLPLIGGLIGGIAAGLGALTGGALKGFFAKTA